MCSGLYEYLKDFYWIIKKRKKERKAIMAEYNLLDQMNRESPSLQADDTSDAIA